MHTIQIATDKLRTTPMGRVRVMRNLDMPENTDVITWCHDIIHAQPQPNIIRRGKNFYVYTNNAVITINAHSHTIITAHKIKK